MPCVSPCGVVVKEFDCGREKSEFKLQSRYYVHFRIDTLGKSLIPVAMS